MRLCWRLTVRAEVRAATLNICTATIVNPTVNANALAVEGTRARDRHTLREFSSLKLCHDEFDADLNLDLNLLATTPQ